MTYMEEVFGDGWAGVFWDEQNNGNITVREHKEFPALRIANYTPKAAYEGTWNEVTKSSRGLIFNDETGEILARPFEKFFNYGQTGAPEIDLDAPLFGVGNKFDGSLGVGYVRPDGKFAIATRGSFHSTQADHANGLVEKWKRKTPGYYLWWLDDARNGYTPLFEIIYPENRIVLDYEQQDYLQPIGWINVSTGRYCPPRSDEGFEYGVTFREVLSWAPRHNAEGYVVWLDDRTAVKIKQEDYVALHAVVTNLSEKRVWEVVKQEDQAAWAEFVAALPDELQVWADGVRLDLMQRVRAEEDRLYRAYDVAADTAWGYTDQDADVITRKNLALAVQDTVRPDDRWAMFSIADGKSIIPKVFDRFKPVGVGSRPSGSIAAQEG